MFAREYIGYGAMSPRFRKSTRMTLCEGNALYSQLEYSNLNNTKPLLCSCTKERFTNPYVIMSSVCIEATRYVRKTTPMGWKGGQTVMVISRFVNLFAFVAFSVCLFVSLSNFLKN